MIYCCYISLYELFLYITFSRNKALEGRVGPAFFLMPFSIIAGSSSALILDSPQYISVPAIILTILYKKPFPVTDISKVSPLSIKKGV